MIYSYTISYGGNNTSEKFIADLNDIINRLYSNDPPNFLSTLEKDGIYRGINSLNSILKEKAENHKNLSFSYFEFYSRGVVQGKIFTEKEPVLDFIIDWNGLRFRTNSQEAISYDS